MNKEELKALFTEANAEVVKDIEAIKAKLAADKGNEELKAELKAANEKAEAVKAEFEKKISDVEKALFDGAAGKTDKNEVFANEFVQEVLKTKSGNIGSFAERAVKLKEKFALTDGQNVTNDADGGYLVPEVMSEEILQKTLNEIVPMLGLTRRFPMGQNLTINTRIGIPAARRDGEGDTALKGKSIYAPLTLTAQRCSVTVPATWEYLNYSLGDARARIVSDVAEAYGAKFLYELFNGVLGSKQMEGILTNTDVKAAATTSSTVGAIVYDDLIDLEGSVETTNESNLRYVMDRRTLAAIRKLQDGAGNYIFQPGSAGKPATINGIPVMVTGNVTVWTGAAQESVRVMPTIAAGNYPVMLADFNGYAFGDTAGMTLMFDDKTGASSATFFWNFHAWNTGKVALPEKFKLLKIKSAS